MSGLRDHDLARLGERFDAAYTIEWLERLLGMDDARVARFRAAVAELSSALPLE
jgi:hypothetical protein